jgi:hypothetical protein
MNQEPMNQQERQYGADPLKPDQIGYRIAEVIALERNAQGSTPLNENHGYTRHFNWVG